MCCMRLTEYIQDAKNRHFGTIAQVCRAMSSEVRHVLTIGKKLLNCNTSSTCSDNMVNFGLLTAEICWRVRGTPANVNGFRVLAALLHSMLYGRQPNFASLNRGRHVYLAGRPSRRALVHISSYGFITVARQWANRQHSHVISWICFISHEASSQSI